MMTQTVLTQDLDTTATSVDEGDASIHDALRESWNMRAQLKRTEASLALVLGALTEFHEGGADYVMHRLSLELRRLAEAPEAAAGMLGCPVDEIDPHLLQAIAAHLYGANEDAVWPVAPKAAVLLH